VSHALATDCLASTGANFPALGLIAAALLVSVGVAVIGVRKKLGKGALALIPILILAGVFAGAAPSARAEAGCGSSTIMPMPSGSASASASESAGPGGVAATVTNQETSHTQDSPWTLTAAGDGPVTFGVFTFSWPANMVARLTVDANTGVVTPPSGADRLSACIGGAAGNTMTGISVGFYANNAYGGIINPVYITIDDHVWCAANLT
jgi:hypothetical protein